MGVQSAEAKWQGDLKAGTGSIRLGSGAFDGPYGFKSRFESGPGTNPEELIAGAHAGCFTMALSAQLTKAGHPPTSLHTTAKVTLSQVPGGFEVSRIDLATDAVVPGIDDAEFQKLAHEAKTGCPISKALAAVKTVELTATLKPA